MVPKDYEACGTCGFDHAYEAQEAADWHAQKDRGRDAHRSTDDKEEA